MIIEPSTHYDADYWLQRKPYRVALHDGSTETRFYTGPAMWWDGFGQLCSTIIDACRVQKSETWFDIGCGGGCFVSFLVQHGIDAYGADISEFAVSHAPFAIRGRVKCQDVLRDTPTAQYDVVSALDLVEHIYREDQEALWEAFTRLTKPKGLLVLDVATAHNAQDVWSLTKGAEVPIEREWQTVSGHVFVQPAEFWYAWAAERGWKPVMSAMLRFQRWRKATPGYAELEAWGWQNFMVFTR